MREPVRTRWPHVEWHGLAVAYVLYTVGLAACAPDPSAAPDAPSATPSEAVEHLRPTDHLARASLALRGVRPSLDELEAVARAPSNLARIVDHYLTTSAYGRTLRRMHAEALLIEVDASLFPAGFPAIGPLEGMETQAINRALMEAPLRLIEHVVMTDRPYTDIVTADYAWADDVVAAAWGLEREAEGEGWSRAYHQDGRAHAGILSDSFLFTRHSTTFSNKSRGRANAVARALLCYDFLDRNVEIDSTIDLADPDLVEVAIRDNPACVSCHQTLDPFAGYFSGYFPVFLPQDIQRYPYRHYATALVRPFRAAESGYFGQPGGDLAQLGAQIAVDHRFSQCAAKRFYAYLMQMDLEDVPLSVASALQAVLVDQGMDAKAMTKAIVLSDDFRSASTALLRMRPDQVARAVETLTGYRWRVDINADFGGGRVGRIDLMEDSLFGFEVLAGGIDGQHVTRPARTVNAGNLLSIRALAAHAAPYVVEHDFASDRHERRLLTDLDALELPSLEGEHGEAVRRQLVTLHARLYSDLLDADAPAVQETWHLFEAAFQRSGGDARHAWTLTLYAMLQDPRFLFY